MNLEYFSTREWALGIWCFIAIVAMSFRVEIRRSIILVLKAFFAWKLQLLFWSLVAIFAFEIITICFIANIWPYLSMKDIVLWFLFVGLPMACSSNANLAKDGSYLKNSILGNFKFIIIIEFIINYYTFNIWIELILMPFIFFFSILGTVNDIKDKDANVKRFINSINVCLGLFLVGFAIKDNVR